MWTALIGPIANIAGSWMNGKLEETKATSSVKVAKAKAEAAIMEKKATGEIDWDIEMARSSASSWKDEWLTILVSIPLILAFTGHEEIVMRGFTALEAMPDFYKTAVGVVFAASFGIQSIKNMMNKK